MQQAFSTNSLKISLVVPLVKIKSRKKQKNIYCRPTISIPPSLRLPVSSLVIPRLLQHYQRL